MQPSEFSPADDQGPDWDIKAIEAALRRRPLPKPPTDLEAKILAEIPPCIGRRSGHRRYTLWIAISAAVLLIAIGIRNFQSGQRVAVDSESEKPLRAENAMLISTAEPNETNPCDILPPLPRWRL